MRATAVLLGIVFGGIILVYDGARGEPSALIGLIGLLGAFLTMLHPRWGFNAFLAAAILSVLIALGDVNTTGFLIYAVMFGIPAMLAYRSAKRNQIAEERAERADRYVRQQMRD